MARWGRPLQFASVQQAGGARGGAAGWAIAAVAAVFGVAGAAVSPEGLLLGLPTSGELVVVAAVVAAIAAAAGIARGRPALGLAPLLALTALAGPSSPTAALTG